jgi:hypothetical protein
MRTPSPGSRRGGQIVGLSVRKVATIATTRVNAPNPTPIARSAFSSAMMVARSGFAMDRIGKETPWSNQRSEGTTFANTTGKVTYVCEICKTEIASGCGYLPELAPWHVPGSIPGTLTRPSNLGAALRIVSDPQPEQLRRPDRGERRGCEE